ncbi:uncharacterized protein LOC112599482 isoform X2 [Melanaphis sacchari]|uniref:uncharacterized protein LOC112599482 isoform X2 n=1 Tax=Melanaphis sacchari TaxID=742174 RepID=UPI000DC14BA6|nr:uncharacterized protein LOC112599482 isoform X2 [Melanaphis sacchari]
MSIFILFIFFFLRHIWIPINADVLPVLGISPCLYSGSYDESGNYGLVSPMPISSLPLECTSFIYDGLIYVDNLDINPNAQSLGIIRGLMNSGKKYFLFYTHGSLENWIKSLENLDVNVEKNKMLLYFNQYSVTGLILKDIDYNFDSGLTYHIDAYFYSSLRDYINNIKRTFINLKVGLYLNASSILYHDKNPTTQDFVDFTQLNGAVDFYIIGFDGFNPCNKDFRNGTVPLNGSHSLMTLSKALNASSIDRNKVYLELYANPIIDSSESILPMSGITYTKLCEDSKKKNEWCADNSDSFYEKAKFAKETIKAQGIVTKYIDRIDPTGACNCDSKNQFITFKMILRGFKLEDPITDCTALNKMNQNHLTNN